MADFNGRKFFSRESPWKGWVSFEEYTRDVISDLESGHAIIAKDGDVVLSPCMIRYRLERMDLLVRADAMARSPIFKAMLFGGFSEASKVSKDSPKTVTLPDDNNVVLWLLVKILHNNTDTLPGKVHLSVLTEFAYLAHKYDCVNLVRGWSRVWVKDPINNLDSRYHREDDFVALLIVPYVLDLWEDFYQISCFLMRRSLMDEDMVQFSVSLTESHYILLPEHVVENIIGERDRWVKAFENRLRWLITDLSTEHPLYHLPLAKRFCPSQQASLGIYTKTLANWSYFQDEPKSLQEYRKIAKAIQSTIFPIANPTCASGACKDLKKKDCKYCKNLVKQIKRTADVLMACFDRRIRGQCLDCTRDGKVHTQKHLPSGDLLCDRR